jgi:hypothetical protein
MKIVDSYTCYLQASSWQSIVNVEMRCCGETLQGPRLQRIAKPRAGSVLREQAESGSTQRLRVA